MLEGYKQQFLNRQAIHALNKRVELPDANLGIGEAEELHSIAMQQKVLSPKMKIVVGSPETTPIEKMTIDGHGPIFSPDDFPVSGFYGNPIGGI